MKTRSDILNKITDPSKPIVRIEHVYKSFGTNDVLRDFSLSFNKGENIVVLGKSGSGKSVLIKCMIGLLQPDAGLIEVLGENIPELSHSALDQIRTRVGFLFQSNALYDSMTIRENLEFPLRRHWISRSHEKAEAMVMEVLTNVGLAHTVDMMPSELSGGMRKRIALARTLILKPDIILYDEPTTGLDPVTSREISELMLDMQKKYNTTSMIISHDIKCIEITADKIVVLFNGQCYAFGTFQELKHSEDINVRQFFN